jgi:peptidoglycan/xylan/chitin deacetylase (PgdA/CDA1 family)
MSYSEHDRFAVPGEKRVFILNFHGLGEPAASQNQSDELLYWTDPHLLATILEALRDRQDVRITFDDSYESDYSIALPLLKASGITARFFVVADRVDQKGFLSSKQIQSLHAEGMTIGSHGMFHRKWPVLNSQELHQEVVGARDQIEQIIGAQVLEAACPFGVYNRKVLQQLRASGYCRVYTSDGGPASAESWIQPRNTIVRGDDLKRVLSLVSESPSAPKAVWRRLKLGLKSWR